MRTTRRFEKDMPGQLDLFPTMHKRSPKTQGERRSDYVKRNPEKVRDYKQKYDELDYLNRRIVGWDSEGVTEETTNKHYLVMITNSIGNTLGKPNKNLKKANLSTLEIFEWVCEQAKLERKAIHVIYGGSYDFNMWLRDIPRCDMERLYKDGEVVWNQYQIKWRQGKFFYLKDLEDPKSASVQIYDVLPFFSSTFVGACESILGDDFPDRELIINQKALRNSFNISDFKEIQRYNLAEVKNLESLVIELRLRLNRIGIRLKRWDGAGAIAANLLSKNNVKDAMAECPTKVAEAARFAYAGGRFEIVQWGAVYEKAYEYDLNSAYPYAMQFLPNLNKGTWKRYTGTKHFPRNDKEFGLYKIHFKHNEDHDDYLEWQPKPLFMRDSKGMMFYPEEAHGWYWASEFLAACAYAKRHNFVVEVEECWVFVEDKGAAKPFAFVGELYKERQRLKKAKDGAQLGIKLGLNSLYGKMAQQIGWGKNYDGSIRKPPFHQLEWAGYVTAMCRSMVYMANIDDLRNVIAFQTDALFTVKPLPQLDTTDGLGHWEETKFDSLTMVQSGVYFATVADEEYSTSPEEDINKTRGFDRGTLTREIAEEGMRLGKVSVARHTSFYRIGLALHQDWNKWCMWITTPRELNPDTWSKRMHIPEFCETCHKHSKPGNIAIERWHSTINGATELGEFNSEFKIEWIQNSITPEHLELINEDRFIREEALYYEY